MSYNTPKIINVFYKEDRKPYDVNGKAISYFGEDFIGANDATKIRFYFTPSISLTEFEGAVHAKRADGELRYEILTKSSDDLGNYLELSLNAWFTGKVGKVTLSVKIYSGDITYGYLVEGEPPTSIESLTDAVIVASDVFSFNVGYAPNATEVAPPFDDTDIDQFLTALSQKASLGQTIYVVPELPENLSDYDNQWFLVKTTGNQGKLYHIVGSTAEEAILEYDINDLQDVNTTSVANGDILRFDTATSTYVNTNALTTAESEIDTLQSEMDAVEGRLDVVEPIVSTNSDDIDTLQEDVDNLETRVTTAENEVDQLQTDVIDLDDRVELIEDTGGIDFIKVADFASLPSSGTARNHRLFLTEDTNKLYEFDGTSFNEVRQDKLTSDLGEENGLVEVTYGTQISYDGIADSNALQVVYTGDGDGSIIEAVNTSGVQFAVNKDGSVNAYGDLTIAGNLTVSGTTTTVNTAVLDVEDNIITINKNQTGTPETNLLSGIEVERGDETNFQFVFQESSDLFKVGQVGDLQAVATREDSPTDKGVAFFNTSTNKFETSGNLKVNTSGQLEDVTIRNSAVGVVPLVVNSVASTTADLQSWQVNGSVFASLGSNGVLRATGVANLTALNNSRIYPETTGALISRNVADGNSALRVNQVNASSTGNIANFQFAGANKLEVTKDGFLTQGGVRLFHQTGGTTNTFFGNQSGTTSVTGTLNTAFGRSSLEKITSGAGNTSVGRTSLQNVTTANNNTAVGVSALLNTNASGNTSVGYASGVSNTTGILNTFIGADAGNNASQLVSASNSTALGNGSFTDKSNQMVFGNANVTEFKFDRNASAVALMPQIDLLGAVGNKSVINYKIGGIGANNGARIALSSIGTNNVIASINMLADNLFDGFQSYIAFNTGGTQLNVERMRITALGKVGIGTNAPATRFSVITTTNGDGIQIRRNSSATNDYSTLGFRTTTADGVDNFSEIRSVRTNRAVSADSDLSFITRTNGSLVERMRIRDDGNVGIGTTNPALVSGTGLVVYNASDTTRLELRNSTTGNLATDGMGLLGAGNNFVIFNRENGILRFDVNGSERLKIESTGLVGINETAPTAQLQVKSGATTRVPLTVNTLASQTANLQEWKVNGGTLAFVTNLGRIATNLGIGSGTANNAYVNTPTTGVVISRNIADSNPALIVNLANASATSDITRFQKAGTTLSTIANNGVFVGESRPRLNDITANATLALVDEGKVLRVNPVTASDDITITIPLNASVAFPINTEIAVLRYGTGTVAISPTAGVELNSINNEREIKGQFGSVALKKIGTDEWVLVGSLEA